MRTILPRTLAALLAVAVPSLALSPAPAAAQKKKEDKEKKKQAKAYVDAGLAAYGGGDYDAAVDFYQRAYDLIPHPVLLFNIAQAHRLAGRTAEALDFYRRYLEADPKGRDADQARGFVKELEPIVARQQEELRKAEEAAAAERARREAEAARETPAEDDPEPEPERPIDDPDPEPDPGPEPSGGGGMSGMRITGIALGGAGLAGIGAGVFFGLKAQRLSDELSQHNAYYDVDKIADGDAAERNMFIAYGVGGALVAAGVVLFVLGGGDDAGDESEELVLTPVVGRDHAGVGLGGRF